MQKNGLEKIDFLKLLIDVKVDGNVYFNSEEYKGSFAQGESEVIGDIEVQ